MLERMPFKKNLYGILYVKTKNPRTFGEVSRISQFYVARRGIEPLLPE